MGLGQPDCDAVEPFRDDPICALALGRRRTPSAPTLRQRRAPLAGHREDLRREELAALVARQALAISPGYQVADQRGGPWMPLDVEGCPCDHSDVHQESDGGTYHRVDDYAPICAYLGEKG